MHKNTSIRCVSFKHNKIKHLQLRTGLWMAEGGGVGIIVRMLTLIHIRGCQRDGSLQGPRHRQLMPARPPSYAVAHTFMVLISG